MPLYCAFPQWNHIDYFAGALDGILSKESMFSVLTYTGDHRITEW